MGREGFEQSLFDCLGQSLDARHFTVFRLDKGQPSLLCAGTRHADSQMVWRCWKAYSHQLHRHDPLLNHLPAQRRSQDELLVSHLLAEDIDFSAYRQALYQNNGMSERLSGLQWEDDGVPVLFNLYRHQGDGHFSDRSIASFEQLAPLLLQLLRGHTAIRSRTPQTGPQHWRSLLLSHAPDLSERELDICLGLLEGLTYAGIAASLEIKETTVKTYRNRAFDRLGIHFRNQLFAMVQSA
ncbi:helix-turn-helix transcriptional regulator [Pseudomonas sp. LRF_L74]|uniref:helix-turn-helix transcriptional regulator n=1 Tax=Pseudomonas sp. LRF_L74 TaxID=3369422 RepID=UPI003F5E95A9